MPDPENLESDVVNLLPEDQFNQAHRDWLNADVGTAEESYACMKMVVALYELVKVLRARICVLTFGDYPGEALDDPKTASPS